MFLSLHKKQLFVGVGVLCLIASCIQATATVSVSWYAQVTGANLFDSSGSGLSVDDMYIQLVVDNGTQTDFSQLISGNIGLTGDAQGWAVDSSASTDVAMDFAAWSDVSAGLYAIGGQDTALDDTYSSSEFYFRWFNAPIIANATEAGFIYSSGSRWMFPSGPTDTTEVNIALDYSDAGNAGSSTGTGWQTVAPVPEPGTIMLFALGLVTLVARRKRG